MKTIFLNFILPLKSIWSCVIKHLEHFLQKHFKDKFPFDVMSYSKKNVIRGLHLQRKKSQAKLITVLKGKILDCVVDLRKNSKTFCKVFKIILSKDNALGLYIPAGFAHGFIVLKRKI